MTEERIEFVDRDYDQSVRVSPSRQIKTRKSSFLNIRERFNRFRLQHLERKLEKKIEKALTEGYTEDNYKSKIAKNANVIARIEEKIMVLSKQKVPANFVAKRAIKLRKSMISNLTYNVSNMYSIGLDNRDSIFGSEEVKETAGRIPEPVVIPSLDKLFVVNEEPEEKETVPQDAVLAAAIPAAQPDEIDVVPSDLERQEIVDVVNSSFAKVRSDVPIPRLTNQEVREVVDEAFENVDEHREEVVLPVESAPPVDREVVRDIIDEAFSEMENGKQETPVQEVVVAENPVPPVPVFDRRGEQEVQQGVEQAIEKIRVSRNNTTPANVSQYDENGYRRERRKKYNYTPMTDEEIRQSQIKLGFDEHGNLIDNGARPKETVVSAKVVGSFTPPVSLPTVRLEDIFVPAKRNIKDVPVVVPDRETPALGLDLDDGKSMFEVIEQPVEKQEDVQVPVVAQSSDMTIDDFNALKEKLLYLQQQKQLTNQQKIDAQKAAKESEQKAQEARKLYEISQENYKQRMAKLRALTASLEADCSENVRSMEQASEEARRNNTYVQEQNELASQNNRIIGEIDLMIGEGQPPVTTTALVVRK